MGPRREAATVGAQITLYPAAWPPPAHIAGPAPAPVPFGIVSGHHSGGGPFLTVGAPGTISPAAPLSPVNTGAALFLPLFILRLVRGFSEVSL